MDECRDEGHGDAQLCWHDSQPPAEASLKQTLESALPDLKIRLTPRSCRRERAEKLRQIPSQAVTVNGSLDIQMLDPSDPLDL